MQLDTHEILNWIQNHKAIILIKQGPQALKTIVENGGPDILIETLHHKDGNEGLEGYWVEISLNDDCAGWSYRDRLVDAIKDAFEAVCEFAIEMGFLEAGTLDLIPCEGNDCAKSWIGQSKFDFQTNKIKYLHDGRWI